MDVVQARENLLKLVKGSEKLKMSRRRMCTNDSLLHVMNVKVRRTSLWQRSDICYLAGAAVHNCFAGESAKMVALF